VLVVNGGNRAARAARRARRAFAHREAAGIDIARKLGNALVAPVMPFSIAGRHLSPKTAGLWVHVPGPLFAAVNEAVVDSMVVNGFKNIVLMGEHGGGPEGARGGGEERPTPSTAAGRACVLLRATSTPRPRTSFSSG